MSIKLWNTAISKLYLWSIAISKSYLWTTQIFSTSAWIAFDAGAWWVSSTPATTFTKSITVWSWVNRILFVTVALNAWTTSWVTYAWNAMTKIDEQAHTWLWAVSLWYIINPTSWTNNMVSTASVSTYHLINGASYTWASQTWIPDATSKTNWSASTYTSVLSSIADNCWHIAGTRSSSASVVAWANTTMRANWWTNGGIFDWNWPITPAGSSTLNITAWSSANYAIVGATFKPA